MIFRRFYDDALAQASYMIGCEEFSEAIVIDPSMDLSTYVTAAAAEGVRIVAVTETHIHADFASGARALAKRVGADLYVSAEGGPEWQYAFAHEPGVHLLHDGDSLSVGRVRLTARHTPGHTPEHLTFIVTDTARSQEPLGALTGDFMFVGDVGRPDLLERAAGKVGTMRDAAASLHSSIQAFKSLPDHLQIWPGHGAGSACGKSMSSAAQSTLGYERAANWALAPRPQTEFVDMVLDDQPPAPPYFGAMKVRNRDAQAVGDSQFPRKVDRDTAETMRSRSNALVLDVRNRDEYDSGHIRGAVIIPLPELADRVGELPRDVPIVVHCQRGGRSAVGAATLDAFGFSDVHELDGGFASWQADRHPVAK